MGHLRSGAVLTLLAAATAVAAGPEREELNVDLMIGWGGCYRPMRWTPVEIGVQSNFRQPLGGVAILSAQQDELTDMTIRQEFVVTRDLPKRIPLAAKIAFAAGKVNLTIRDLKGKVRWDHDYELTSFSGQGAAYGSRLTVVNDQDTLIGLVGRRGFEIGRLGSHSRSHFAGGGEAGKVYVKDCLPRLLPLDWTGYDSLDLLVLYDADYGQLTKDQQLALRDWVSAGGRLFIVLGGRGLPGGTAIADMLPLSLGQPKQTPLPTGWRTMPRVAGARLPTWPANVTCWPLRLRGEPIGWKLESYGEQETLLASGPVGFGRVAVLAFDPAELKETDSRNAAAVWVELVRPLLHNRQLTYLPEERPEQDDPSYYENRFHLGPEHAATNEVLNHLLSIRELRPLSIWWVILLLTTLALLLGPVDYLVLKKLDRLPWTWVTSTACIVIFSVGAYYGVKALRSGALQVRAVSVMDGLAGGAAPPAGWSTVYSGIFAPDSEDYRLDGLAAGQWWSSVTPTSNDWLYSYNRQMATRRISCAQADGSNLPYSVPINIWSMQCLLTESPVPADKLPLRAELLYEGTKVTLRITNASDQPVDWGFAWAPVVWRGMEEGETRVLGIGAATIALSGLAPGRTEEHVGEAAPGRKPPGNLFENVSSRDPQHAFRAAGVDRRTAAIEALAAQGAAVICARYASPRAPLAVKGHACQFDHVQFVRLVVLPKEAPPASRPTRN